MTSSEDAYDYSDAEPSETGEAPPEQPWWRKPIVSLILGVIIAFVLGIAIFLLADKTSDRSGTTQTPTSPTTSVNIPSHPTP